MDTSYLAQQVNSSIGQLHSLFDEIGVPTHERQARESEVRREPLMLRLPPCYCKADPSRQLFSALSEALNNQVRLVTSEKKEMIEEAKNIITVIRQMETSLDDCKSRRDYDTDDVTITYPLNHCLQSLKEKQAQISRLHRERFEQVKSKRHLANLLRRYADCFPT